MTLLPSDPVAMSNLLRLVYASRASFPVPRESAGILPEVARILTQSRRNNPRRGLVGALYFGDGCFFQCLEGPADEVEALYHRLHDDPRHYDLQVLSRRPVPSTSFSGWSMKLVPDAAQVRALMARRGRPTFDPYSFDDALQDELVQLLLKGPDAGLPTPVADDPLRSEPLAQRVAWALALGVAGTMLGAAALAIVLMR